MTSPGIVPTEKEWDMNTETENEENVSDELSSEESNLLTNQNIKRNTDYPREPAHEDLKYLKSGEGPLI